MSEWTIWAGLLTGWPIWRSGAWTVRQLAVAPPPFSPCLIFSGAGDTDPSLIVAGAPRSNFSAPLQLCRQVWLPEQTARHCVDIIVACGVA